MNLDEKMGYRPLLSWLSLAVLVVLVCVLGVLQYRWIGEISQTERKKLQDTLQASLNEVSRDFNSELNTACTALVPTEADVNELGREQAYENRYLHWKESGRNSKFFARTALAWEQGGELTLRMLNPDTGVFALADWPASWSPFKAMAESHFRREPGGPLESMRLLSATALIELPRFSASRDVMRSRPPSGHDGRSRGFDHGGGFGEQEWLLQWSN